MGRTNFFERQAPILPKKTVTLPTFGEVVLEKMDNVKGMRFRAIVREKIAHYLVNPFPPIGDKVIDITDEWAESAAALMVMQVQDEPYSFEELIAASITDEEEYNQLATEANELNSEVSVDPKLPASGKVSSDLPEEV